MGNTVDLTNAGSLGPLVQVTGVPGTPVTVYATQTGCLLTYLGSSSTQVQFNMPNLPPVGTFYYVFQGNYGTGGMKLQAGASDKFTSQSTGFGALGGSASTTTAFQSISVVMYMGQNVWALTSTPAWTVA